MTSPVVSPIGRRGGLLRRFRVEHVRFVLVGIYNTAFGYAVFAALHLLFPRLGYMLVLVAAHVCSVLSAFVAYRTFVFKVRGHVLRDLARFWLVYLVSLALNVVLLPALVEGVGLDVLAAQAAVVLVTAMASFVGHERFSFRRPEPTEEVADAVA